MENASHWNQLEGLCEWSSEKLNQWCIEHGVPRFGVDYSSSDNLHAASLERRTVSWSKGCYLGQEVVCMQDMRGKVNRRLVSLQTESSLDDSLLGEPLKNEEDTVVGEVKSLFEKCAIVSVKSPHFEEGSLLKLGPTTGRVKPLRA